MLDWGIMPFDLLLSYTYQEIPQEEMPPSKKHHQVNYKSKLAPSRENSTRSTFSKKASIKSFMECLQPSLLLLRILFSKMRCFLYKTTHLVPNLFIFSNLSIKMHVESQLRYLKRTTSSWRS